MYVCTCVHCKCYTKCAFLQRLTYTMQGVLGATFRHCLTSLQRAHRYYTHAWEERYNFYTLHEGFLILLVHSVLNRKVAGLNRIWAFFNSWINIVQCVKPTHEYLAVYNKIARFLRTQCAIACRNSVYIFCITVSWFISALCRWASSLAILWTLWT